MFLSAHADHVHMLIRGGDLAAGMSDYLVERIEASPKITLHCNTEVVGLEGDRFLERVRTRNNETGEEREWPVTNLFLMIGAVPNTEWLGDCVQRDEKGFVCTGGDATAWWQGHGSPGLLETSQPGVFAVGDARANSVKRVASAVGEGSVSVQSLHQAVLALKAE